MELRPLASYACSDAFFNYDSRFAIVWGAHGVGPMRSGAGPDERLGSPTVQLSNECSLLLIGSISHRCMYSVAAFEEKLDAV